MMGSALIYLISKSDAPLLAGIWLAQQAEASPQIVGFAFSLITAALSGLIVYFTQRSKIAAENAKLNAERDKLKAEQDKIRAEVRDIAEQADEKVFKRMESLATWQESEIEKLRTQIEDGAKKLADTAAGWATERKGLHERLAESQDIIKRLQAELDDLRRKSAREIGELQLKNVRQEEEMKQLQAKLQELEAENIHLREGEQSRKKI